MPTSKKYLLGLSRAQMAVKLEDLYLKLAECREEAKRLGPDVYPGAAMGLADAMSGISRAQTVLLTVGGD